MKGIAGSRKSVVSNPRNRPHCGRLWADRRHKDASPFYLPFFRPPSPGGKSPPNSGKPVRRGRGPASPRRRAHRASQRPTRGGFCASGISPSASHENPRFQAFERTPGSDLPCQQSTWTYCQAVFPCDRKQLDKSPPMFTWSGSPGMRRNALRQDTVRDIHPNSFRSVPCSSRSFWSARLSAPPQ